MTSSAPSALVVDASVAIAMSVNEPSSEDVLHILSGRRAAGGALLVPTFFWLEVVNVLMRRHRLTPAQVLEAVVELQSMGLESAELDRPQLLLAFDAMARTGLSAYDAAYLALAESADAQLLTADKRLAAAVGDRALPVDGGHAVNETSQAYEPSRADWPGAAAYLKQLRAQVVRQANG